LLNEPYAWEARVDIYALRSPFPMEFYPPRRLNASVFPDGGVLEWVGERLAAWPDVLRMSFSPASARVVARPASLAGFRGGLSFSVPLSFMASPVVRARWV